MRGTVIGIHTWSGRWQNVPSGDHGCHSSTAAKGEVSVKHSKAAAEQASVDL